MQLKYLKNIQSPDDIRDYSIDELKDGNFLSAATRAFMIKANGVIFNFSPV